MPRIPSSNRPQDAAALAQTVEREEVEQQQEETQAATEGQQSFFASEIVSDAELRPHLRDLRKQVPQLQLLRTREVVNRGYSPSVLQGADLTVLREAYQWFHDHLPQTALAHDLELAWAGGVERHLGSVRYSLSKITDKAQGVLAGKQTDVAFFAAWDRESGALRAAANAQLAAAQADAPMGPHETFFYQQLLAALDEFSAPVGVCKAKQEVPSAQLLNRLVSRLQQVAEFSRLEKYV